MVKTFWEANRVFIIGLFTAVATALYQFLFAEEGDTGVWVYVALTAALSYLGKEWRGKGVSILGILGTAAAIIATDLSDDYKVSWLHIIIALLIEFGFIVMPPPKADVYETDPMIQQAKTMMAKEDTVIKLLE